MAVAPEKLSFDQYFASFLCRTLKLDDFFSEFLDEHIAKLFPRSGLYAFPVGWRLIQQDQAGRDIFIIYRGKVSITRTFGSAAAEVATLGPGDLLGEVALLSDGVRMASATVAEVSQIFHLTSADIQYILKNNEVLAIHLKALATARLGRAH